MNRKLLHGNIPAREKEPEIPKGIGFMLAGIIGIIVWAVIIFLIIIFCCDKTPAYTVDEYANNIRITEGIHSHYPYGIKSVHAKNAKEARIICKRTIWHTWLRYCKQGGNARDSKGFIYYMADIYCPYSVDPIGNMRWKNNMCKLMNV